jgi:hypothetical protein
VRESGFVIIGVAVIVAVIALIAMSLSGRYWNSAVVPPQSSVEGPSEPEGGT